MTWEKQGYPTTFSKLKQTAEINYAREFEDDFGTRPNQKDRHINISELLLQLHLGGDHRAVGKAKFRRDVEADICNARGTCEVELCSPDAGVTQRAHNDVYIHQRGCESGDRLVVDGDNLRTLTRQRVESVVG